VVGVGWGGGCGGAVAGRIGELRVGGWGSAQSAEQCA